ncbi:MAG: YqcC family protein [Xanthomonadales bacterium]|nr:YqcC family protein [Xanthomonadales bacterium]
MSDRHEVARALLFEIRGELRGLGLWESQPPAGDALDSDVPFGFDRLQFNQWLQWVFLPRTHAVLDAGRDLPGKSDISPMAEWFCEEHDLPGDRLVELIRSFDRLWR